MHTFSNYSYSDEQLEQRIQDILSEEKKTLNRKEALKTILSVIDLTTLEGSDNTAKVTALSKTALSFKDEAKDIPAVAAVCVYPTFVKTVKQALGNSTIGVASVAGAFPSGQSPIAVKLAEIEYAVNEGADDIDMVISRGKMLEGDYDTVFDEIKAIKGVCGKAHLKVILETGELQSIENIRKASELAINAGGDFLKTSTGKIPVAATLRAFIIMLDTIEEYYKATGKMVGIKPAGGISDPDTAIDYYLLVKHILGEKWLNNTWFRIGASRLATKVYNELV